MEFSIAGLKEVYILLGCTHAPRGTSFFFKLSMSAKIESLICAAFDLTYAAGKSSLIKTHNGFEDEIKKFFLAKMRQSKPSENCADSADEILKAMVRDLLKCFGSYATRMKTRHDCQDTAQDWLDAAKIVGHALSHIVKNDNFTGTARQDVQDHDVPEESPSLTSFLDKIPEDIKGLSGHFSCSR